MNEEHKNLDEFEDLFKEHNIKPKPETPKHKSPYVYALLYYLFAMFVLSTIIGLIFMSIDRFNETINQDQQVLTAVTTDASVMTLIPLDTYALYADDFQGYAESLGRYDGYEVIVNMLNQYAYEDLLNDDDSLNVEHLEAILSGTTTYWDANNTYEIIIYESSESPLPDIVSVETELVSDLTTHMTFFASSLWNFVTYMALTPVLAILLLKRDITADLLVLKKRKHDILPALLIGYALILVGNFLSNFISTQLGALLGVMPSIASNQLSIEQSLSSSGVVFIFLSAVILGPIAEELVFRKSIFSLFKNDYVGLVVSALAFGAVHLLSETSLTGVLVNGLVYIILGFVFGYIYLRNKKNIVLMIGIHMLSNLISVVASLLLF